MLSVWLTCGLFAKYAVSSSASDLATVAKFGGVSVEEHKVESITDTSTMIEKNSMYDYTLENNAKVVSTTTKKEYNLVAGTVIPKDTYVVVDGTNDVACNLYIEVVNSDKNNCVTFDIDNNWSEIEDSSVTAQHGGTIYKYNKTISAHESLNTGSIIKESTINISDACYDKSNQKTDTFSIDFYAYLVQLD
jgi:hypothetical protein